MLGPMLIAMICIIFHQGNIAISILITAIVELYPIADSLGTVFFVKPYYNAIFGTGKNRNDDTVDEQKSEPPDSEGLTSV